MKRRRCAELVITTAALCYLAAAGSAMAGGQAAKTKGELGRAIYTNCAACHGSDGQGGFGPPLAGRSSLADKERAIAKILAGSPHMPPFGEQLSPGEIAELMNWMSRRWSRGSVRVSAADVTAIAARMKAGRK